MSRRPPVSDPDSTSLSHILSVGLQRSLDIDAKAERTARSRAGVRNNELGVRPRKKPADSGPLPGAAAPNFYAFPKPQMLIPTATVNLDTIYTEDNEGSWEWLVQWALENPNTPVYKETPMIMYRNTKIRGQSKLTEDTVYMQRVVGYLAARYHTDNNPVTNLGTEAKDVKGAPTIVSWNNRVAGTVIGMWIKDEFDPDAKFTGQLGVRMTNAQGRFLRARMAWRCDRDGPTTRPTTMTDSKPVEYLWRAPEEKVAWPGYEKFGMISTGQSLAANPTGFGTLVSGDGLFKYTGFFSSNLMTGPGVVYQDVAERSNIGPGVFDQGVRLPSVVREVNLLSNLPYDSRWLVRDTALRPFGLQASGPGALLANAPVYLRLAQPPALQTVCNMFQAIDPRQLGSGRDSTYRGAESLRVIGAYEIDHSESGRRAEFLHLRDEVFGKTRCDDVKPFCVRSTKAATDEYLAQMGMRPELNEQLLFHATSLESTLKIIQSGFDMSYAQRGLFGKGIYFADNPVKSDQYAQNILASSTSKSQLRTFGITDQPLTYNEDTKYVQCASTFDPGRFVDENIMGFSDAPKRLNNVCCMLINRVVLGCQASVDPGSFYQNRTLHTNKRVFQPEDGVSSTSMQSKLMPEWNSVFGSGKIRFNEYIGFDNLMALPTMLVFYTRSNTADIGLWGKGHVLGHQEATDMYYCEPRDSPTNMEV